MSESTGNIQNTITNSMNQFSSPAEVATKDTGFLTSNGIIAKVVFLIMVIIIFVFLFYLIVSLISYFSTPSKNPMLIKGQLDGNHGQVIIPQNPANKSSKPIHRSNNEMSGIEFTWCVWLKYTGQSVGQPVGNSDIKYSPIFIKGDCTLPSSIQKSYCSVNHGPGAYFYVTDSIHLNILMDTVNTPASKTTPDTSTQIIDISNLPHNQYFHVGIRCQGTNIDTYINGTIIKRQNLGNVPKQNFYDLFVCPKDGFPGYLSNLQYYSRALSVIELNSIYQAGPDTNPFVASKSKDKQITPISTSWFNNFLK